MHRIVSYIAHWSSFTRVNGVKQLKNFVVQIFKSSRLVVVFLSLSFFVTPQLYAQAYKQGYKQKEDYEGCGGIVDKDKKLYCEAVDSGKDSFCKSISSADLKNMCYGKVNNDEQACEKISNAKQKTRCKQYLR